MKIICINQELDKKSEHTFKTYLNLNRFEEFSIYQDKENLLVFEGISNTGNSIKYRLFCKLSEFDDFVKETNDLLECDEYDEDNIDRFTEDDEEDEK